MVSYHCSMPVLENVQVSLNEILEVRGQPLQEYELWGLLFQATEAVQDIFLRGHACKDDIPLYLVTPSNLLCTARGKVILNECLPDSMRGTTYWCSEMEDKEFYSEIHNLEKIYVFTLGQTMLCAAYYKVQDNCQRKLSPLIKTVFQAMCQSDVDLRMILSDVAQVCSLHATKYMNGFTFAKSVATLHREVLGSLPEHEILAQVDRDVMMEKEVEHSEGGNEDFSDVNYNPKYYAYGYRLGYYPELSKATKSSLSKNSVTPKERWQKAYSAVLKEVRRSKISFIKKDEVFEAWKNHKAQQSIFRVYEELTERRKMLELLRLSINIEPSTPVDVDKNPLLMTGLKPKTIAELVLLLQRPSKQSAAYSKSKSEAPCSSTESSEEQLEEENYEKPYYAIDKIALQEPFPLTKLDCNLKKSYPGPEFVINKLKPHTKIMPFYYNKDLKPTFTVSISLLNGESIDVECLPSVNGKQLYQAVADHLKLQERYLFGLAYAQGGEYIFIERKQRLVDVLQLCATSSTLVSADLIHLFFKVKFYVDDVHLLRTQALRHIFYLQLRKDFLEDDFYCDIDSAIMLGGLALQAEFGNYDQSVHGKEYFLLEHYLSFSNILCLNRLTAKTRLRDQHINLAGISKELAELKFIQAMMKFSDYGSHYHKVLQDKKNTSSVVWLSIRSKGIAVYENISGKRSLCQNYPWEIIKRISFSKKYFCIAPKTESITGRHVVYRFYTSLLHRSQYLFNMSMAHHKFFLKLKSVSKASEIFTEDLDEEHPYDKSEVEKEIGWDLCDNADKFELRISKMARRINSLKKSSKFLKRDFIFSKSEKGLYKNNSLSSIELDIMRKRKLSSNLVTRSSSAPVPVKKSDYFSGSKVLSVNDLQPRVVSLQPKSSCGKQSMKVVKLHKDPEYGLGMVITCGNTYDTILHGAFVESVYPGSPADLDGSIKPGDQIMSVNGVDVRNDHFLTVVDLIQYSNGPVDLLIGKNNDFAPGISVFSNKEITEKSFVKSKAWIVGSENTTECMSPDSKSEKNKTYIDTPIPIPRKKWVERKENSIKPMNFDAPDLTINHSTNFSNNESQNQDSDSIDLNGHFNSKNCNIPDIIASQIKHGFETSPFSRDECLDSEESCPTVATLDANDFLPGEVYHVVLDKKGGSSLGLYIYQDLESTCSEQGDIYIHSIIPNSPAELDGRIQPGDRILEMNGVLLENLSYQEIVTKIRESPQVVHLVLEKGKPIETKCLRNEMHQKETDSVISDLTEPSSTKDFSSLRANKTQEKSKNDYIIPASFELSNELVSNSTDNSFSSLPTSTASPTSHSAKERNSAPSSYQHNSSNKNTVSDGISSLSSAHSDAGFSSKLNSAKGFSSHPHAKVRNQSNDGCRTPKTNPNSLTSYKSTPNLADNSDEEDISKSHYLNKSYDCLLSPLFMHPHQALIDFYQNYSYIRGSSSNIHQIPAVPIRKKKLKKIEDIYNYSNSENTFYVSIRKSSRGLGLSILGGRDACKNDPFSQLIRIRKLYPLQPALECGKLAIGDVILEVNGTNMIGLTNTEALEVLRSAPMDVVLKVFRPSKSLIPSFSTYKGAIWPLFDSSSSSASSSLSHRETNSYNVETGEFEVTLVKRGGSLGFTISKKEISGENPTEGIYVKALVREPAASDGRIQPGDQILEVNGTTISSMSHSEAISFLRNTPNAVTLKLYRGETNATSGGLEDYHISKPLRWEALELLNDRVKHKDHEEYNTLKKKIKKKLENVSNAPSNSSTESGSTSSSSGQEHVIDESLETSISEDLALEGIGLQRNQRPKSLDVLNSSDRKHCSGFTEEDVFHRQSSVMCPNVEQKVKSESSQNESPTKKGGKNLLKWRGSTLPDSEDSNSLTGHEMFNISSQSNCTADTSNPVELSSDDEKPVPYPRTTSYKSEWVNSFEVCLDRGWHGRLGFSLFDPPPVEPDSPRNLLPISAEVKAVYPGSLADKDGRIKVGDRIVEVNKECLLNKSATEVIDILRKTRGVTKMIFCRLEKRS